MGISDYLLLTGLGIIVISSLFAAVTGFNNSNSQDADETPFLTFLGGIIVFGCLALVGWTVYGIVVFIRWLL